MMKSTAAAVGLLAIGLTTAPTLAAPFGTGATDRPAAADRVVDQVQYRRDCVWTGTGWGYRHRGAVLACRPYRPVGPGWVWYSQGPRHGWYHPHRKVWHYNKW